MRILLVEDDFMVGKYVKNALELDGNIVDLIFDCASAEAAIATTKFDLVILDLNLPDGSGSDFLSKMRSQNYITPVLILTAKNSPSSKVQNLDLGADDYLTKPFDLEELLARIRAIRRRSQGFATSILRCGVLELDQKAHLVTKNGVALELSPHEFSILQMLMENNHKVVSKSKLENSLYSWDDNVESNVIEVHIHNLRKKIGENFIKNIRSVGYMIDAA